MFIPIDRRTLILKNGGRAFFLRNQSFNVIYLNEENKFMVPTHEKKEDYYENPCLCQLSANFYFEKMVEKKSLSYKAKASMQFILMSRMCLWCLVMKKVGIIM